MDVMDIQAVESKLSDVTVTPIPRSQVQNFYHQQQQQQREQQPQIQISAIHHIPQQQQQNSNNNNNNNNNNNHNNHQSTTHQIQVKVQPQIVQNPQTSPIVITTLTSANITTPMTSAANIPSTLTNLQGLTKYAQLLAVIEEMGRDLHPTYTGSRSSTERLKRGIVHARILVRECLLETERSAARQ